MTSKQNVSPENSHQELASFIRDQILPNLTEEQRDNLVSMVELKIDEEFLRKEWGYECLVGFSPDQRTEDGWRPSFFNDVISPFFLIAVSEHSEKFGDIKGLFIQKANAYAEDLFRVAFYRNSYENIEAWRDCAEFKEYRPLFRALGIMPRGSEEHIEGMGKELDAIWSRPEVERILRGDQADEVVEMLGGKEGSSLERIYRDEPITPSRTHYEFLHEIRPDLVAETFEEYLAEEEARKHPFRLNL